MPRRPRAVRSAPAALDPAPATSAPTSPPAAAPGGAAGQGEAGTGAQPRALVGDRAAYALAVLLLVLTTLWGAFLVPLRIGTTVVPVSLAVVVVANLVLGVAGGRLFGRRGSIALGVLWLLLGLLLGVRRPEGDIVLTNTVVASAYLLLGAVASTAAVVLAARPSPGAGGGRGQDRGPDQQRGGRAS